MILIFTNKEDAHPTNVIKYLKEWGTSFFRLNTECLLTDYKFSWWCNENGSDFYIKNIKTNLELWGHDITAIWERRPQNPEFLPVEHNEQSINRHLLGEGEEFLSFLRFYLRGIYSIGSIVEDRPAGSKMLQLSVAQQLGMKIPSTVMGNYKDSFVELCDTYQNISLKQLSDFSIIVDDEKEYVFYSQKALSADVMAQPEGAFSQSVCFLQNYVEKKYELRITVCNEDVIACKIDSQILDEDKGKIDWRQGYDFGLKQEIVEIPEKVKTFCQNFLKKMNLNFGCFDFIVTPNDDYVFLECNPNGQWLWIELQTSFDISKIIAMNLAKYELMK